MGCYKIKPCLILTTVINKRLFILLVLILPLSSSQTVNTDPNCQNIVCNSPPSDAKCEVVDPGDKSIPQPTGPKAFCCPLMKCRRSSTPPGDFFTFHGLSGAGPKIDGSETVQYGMTRSLNSVSSDATGGHDSNAHAGGSKDEISGALAEINRVLGKIGLGNLG